MTTEFDPLSKILGEHVATPGFRQIVVTRDWLFRWLKGLGWSTHQRGFASLDYMVFGRPALNDPLTPESERDRILAQVQDTFRRSAETEGF